MDDSTVNCSGKPIERESVIAQSRQPNMLGEIRARIHLDRVECILRQLSLHESRITGFRGFNSCTTLRAGF